MQRARQTQPSRRRRQPIHLESPVLVSAAAQVIAERVPREIVIEPRDDNSCIVHARSNSIEMLALYLGMLDADFRVTDPPELVERMKKLATRFAGAVA